MIEIIIFLFIISGLFFFLVGTLGFLRFPDTFTRIHATTKCDTLATLLSLTGLAIYSGFNTHSIKLFLVIMFIWVTNPTATHLISKAAMLSKNAKSSKSGSSMEV